MEGCVDPRIEPACKFGSPTPSQTDLASRGLSGHAKGVSGYIKGPAWSGRSELEQARWQMR